METLQLEKLLEKAVQIATGAHQGQTDRYGAPYIGHVLRVMAAGRTLDEKIVGALHDVVEDTSWTFEQLAEEGFPNHLLAALRCVTKESEAEDYDVFVARTATNALAIRVKLNDLADNMDVRRMMEVTDTDRERLNKYLKAYRYLSRLI